MGYINRHDEFRSNSSLRSETMDGSVVYAGALLTKQGGDEQDHTTPANVSSCKLTSLHCSDIASGADGSFTAPTYTLKEDGTVERKLEKAGEHVKTVTCLNCKAPAIKKVGCVTVTCGVCTKTYCWLCKKPITDSDHMLAEHELYVDFFQFRKKYPTDVLLIGMYGIDEDNSMFVFVKKDDGKPREEEDKWYERCFKATSKQPIPYHRLLRVKGFGVLYDLVRRTVTDPTRINDIGFKISDGLLERHDYRHRYAYYISQYHGYYISVVNGAHYLNDDSFKYLISLIDSLQEYDTKDGGLTSEDIQYVPRHPIELIQTDENGVIVSGFESVTEAYNMREFVLLGSYPYTGGINSENDNNEKERVLICYVTEEEFDDCEDPMGWCRDILQTDVSNYLRIKFDDFIKNLLSRDNILFDGDCIYTYWKNFEKTRKVRFCYCASLKSQILACERIHEKKAS